MVAVKQLVMGLAVWVLSFCALPSLNAEEADTLSSSPVFAAKKTKDVKVTVMGLFSNSAVMQIDGKERILKAGKTSPEGVTLISANPKQAEIDNNGKRETLVLNRGVGTRFSEPPTTEVRIASQVNGHYVTPGRINNRSVEFLIDTGATSIAMNSTTARELGIQFNPDNAISVQTAQGSTKAFPVVLDSAAVGALVVYSPEAIVLEGDYPTSILLGNTFLSRVDLKVEQGVMVLQTKY